VIDQREWRQTGRCERLHPHTPHLHAPADETVVQLRCLEPNSLFPQRENGLMERDLFRPGRVERTQDEAD